MNLLKKSWIYLIVIFVSGLIAGLAIGVFLARQQSLHIFSTSYIADGVNRQLVTKLELDAAQQARVKPLIDRTMQRIARIYYRTMEEIDLAVQDAGKELVTDLRPDQIQKLNTLASSRKEFIQKHNPLRQLEPPATPENAANPK